METSSPIALLCDIMTTVLNAEGLIDKTLNDVISTQAPDGMAVAEGTDSDDGMCLSI